MRYILLFLGSFFSLCTMAQPATYIVKQDGDTVRGEVKILTKQVRVISAADTAIYNSEDIRLFVKDGNPKIVLRLMLYGYTDNIYEIQSSTYSNPVYDTTILLTPVISGEKLNLFTGKDKRKVVYFFVQRAEDKVPIQLLYVIGGDMPQKASWGHPYQYIDYITHHRIFQSQLWEMLSDCEYISTVNIQALDYRESSLKAFIKRYNKKCD